MDHSSKRRGAREGTVETCYLSFFCSPVNNNSGARWVVVHLLLLQPEARVSVLPTLFSSSSLQREVAVLLKLVTADGILLVFAMLM